MDKMKLFFGIILFGSIWGFSECIIGPSISDAGLPSGAIMTGFFAIGLMMISRLLFRQRGMQLGMGMIAGLLRLFNPFGGCVICSAIAIATEALIFEVIFYNLSFDLKELKNLTMKTSIGVISSYCCYVGGYIVTQILTPMVSTAGFNVLNFIQFIPQILSRGLPAALIGALIIPSIFLLKNIDIYSIKDRIYYPTASAVSVFCWLFVIINSLILVGS